MRACASVCKLNVFFLTHANDTITLTGQDSKNNVIHQNNMARQSLSIKFYFSCHFEILNGTEYEAK